MKKLILWSILITSLQLYAGKHAPLILDCDSFPCNEVLPEARTFQKVENAPYWQGFDANGNVVGWIVLSTDVVKIKAYSGEPLETLIGLSPTGTITGAKIIRHSEPILLVGIPEKKLHDFVDFYTGKEATQEVVVGKSSKPGMLEIDVISGATVTALAQNRTILDTARTLGSAVGIIERTPDVPGHFIDTGKLYSWSELERKDIFGRLTVDQNEMDPSQPSKQDQPFIDLYFTLIDSEDIGKSLLAEGDYNWLKNQLKDGEHLLLVFGNGSSSFKGSGFVRGGIFDRVRVEQGLDTMFFRDTDYMNVSNHDAIGGPAFKEGAVFFIRDGKMDPGQHFDLVFLGSYYDGKGGFSREFREFRTTFRMPRAVYALNGPDPDTLIWRQAWNNKKAEAIILIAWLVLVVGLFVQRSWLTGRLSRLKIIHTVVLFGSLMILGFWFHAQPSITQILTVVGSVVGEWDLNLFLSEPFLFISWIFIAVTTLIWGRGIFCGWVCPFGALSELLFKIGAKFGIKAWEFPDGVHSKLRWLRYILFLGLVPAFIYSPELGERLAEVEPFKTTFFVVPWSRSILFFSWWLLLLVASTFMFRPFCRYICPLGAALAIPSSFRPSGPYRRNFCSSCKICTNGCEPKAIRRDGTIDSRECLSCMECEANYEEVKVCPPLRGLDKLNQKDKNLWTPSEIEKEQKLIEGSMKV